MDNSTLNMLSLTFSYGHEHINLVTGTGYGLSVKDNMYYVRSRVHYVYASRGAIV